ncbi:hypothetical protein BLNAU_266 [Blattamonas nauphoetae]|uniref:Uncharacterized protein n=1 Tax=Blattamonas nauphoetae TaxID=2049346 RepID=A0ABQ9YMG8_9EUKA|nr:hypothetical protein BLNAU_266 [Blattamonas nauphoetae]
MFKVKTPSAFMKMEPDPDLPFLPETLPGLDYALYDRKRWKQLTQKYQVIANTSNSLGRSLETSKVIDMFHNDLSQFKKAADDLTTICEETKHMHDSVVNLVQSLKDLESWIDSHTLQKERTRLAEIQKQKDIEFAKVRQGHLIQQRAMRSSLGLDNDPAFILEGDMDVGIEYLDNPSS